MRLPSFCLSFLFAVREEQRCLSRRAARSFAKSSAVVRERQITLLCRRCQSSLPFSKIESTFFNVSLIYRCCQDTSKVAQLSQVNISAICHPEQREGSRAGTLQETLRDASHSFSMTESIRIQKHRRFHLRNLSKVESDHL